MTTETSPQKWLAGLDHTECSCPDVVEWVMSYIMKKEANLHLQARTGDYVTRGLDLLCHETGGPIPTILIQTVYSKPPNNRRAFFTC